MQKFCSSITGTSGPLHTSPINLVDSGFGDLATLLNFVYKISRYFSQYMYVRRRARAFAEIPVFVA